MPDLAARRGLDRVIVIAAPELANPRRQRLDWTGDAPGDEITDQQRGRDAQRPEQQQAIRDRLKELTRIGERAQRVR